MGVSFLGNRCRRYLGWNQLPPSERGGESSQGMDAIHAEAKLMDSGLAGYARAPE